MPNQRLGQHWLKDPSVLEEIVLTAGIKPGQTVLEVGPGQGALTDKLAAAGARVTAVELDSELTDKLKRTFAGSQRIRIVHQDIRQYDLSRLEPDYKVVANLPYYLSAPLLKKLTESANPPSQLVLLVQREVAVRLAAQPGQLSVIGLAAQLFGRVTLGSVVPASAFVPPPKVTSQIVAIERLAVGVDHRAELMALVRRGFASRRKTLLNNLKSAGLIDDHMTADMATKIGINKRARAQELSLEQWQKLYYFLETESDGKS